MKIKDFIWHLNNLYPIKNKEPWDPSGYSVKFNQAKKLKGVVFAIDVTNEVVDYAIENDCNLIVTHHPFWFEKTKIVENIKAPYKNDLYLKLKNHQINAFSMHTNYDSDLYGTSYQILKYLSLENHFQYGSDKYSASISGKFTFNQIVELIEQKLKLTAFRTNFPKQKYNSTLKKIVFLSGSGYIGSINDLHKRKYDLIISSDFKWSDWITFNELNTPILEIPHLDEQVFAWHMHDLCLKLHPKLKLLVKEIKIPFYNLK
ncbi:Nif3-like dinuclear metal center hexameric protein [Mycoplasmopsis cricetuli]|uniref:Nif3-like dinuclear metal center hexameric protein n=1 Tax=Mycoplasmopsis cricetuli TaxID=171283 RepID=UPI00046F44F1|nr:Nif3-like dinuclear metal center hexameric protein [Mycoplasmopsis cricetuli]